MADRITISQALTALGITAIASTSVIIGESLNDLELEDSQGNIIEFTNKTEMLDFALNDKVLHDYDLLVDIAETATEKDDEYQTRLKSELKSDAETMAAGGDVGMDRAALMYGIYRQDKEKNPQTFSSMEEFSTYFLTLF